MSNKAHQKSEREVTEFCHFAEIIREWIAVSEVRPQPQGYADISAKLGNEVISFELLSIVDEDMAQNQIDGNWADVNKKLSAKVTSKTYKDNGPIELLIYSKATFLTTDMILHESQNTLWRDNTGPFRRIWFFTEDNRVFLFNRGWWSQIGLMP